MANVNTQWVYYKGYSGANTRQPGSAAYNVYAEVPNVFPVNNPLPPPGNQWQASPTSPQYTFPDPSDPTKMITVVFAFMSVSGYADGGKISVNPNTPPPSGTVGAADINVLNLYVPVGGGGTGTGSGARIDAFDETTGKFNNDTFVSVNPETNPANTGNTYGFVDTTNQAELITALAPPKMYPSGNPDNLLFDGWNIVSGSGNTVQPAPGLNVAKGANMVAFAFYKQPKPKESKDFEKPHIVDVPLKQIGDTIGPIDKGDPVINQLLQGLAVLNQRIAVLEGTIAGQAFIKSQDRPAVGAAAAKKASSRR